MAYRDPRKARQVRGPPRWVSAREKIECCPSPRGEQYQQASACSACNLRDGGVPVGTACHASRKEHGDRDPRAHAGAVPGSRRMDLPQKRAFGNQSKRSAIQATSKLNVTTTAGPLACRPLESSKNLGWAVLTW